MASADSGVETGNESNDGPLDSKPETSRGWFTAASNVYYTLSERSSLFRTDADSVRTWLIIMQQVKYVSAWYG